MKRALKLLYNRVFSVLVLVLVLVLELLSLLLVPTSQILPKASHWIMVLKHEFHLSDILKFCFHLQEKTHVPITKNWVTLFRNMTAACCEKHTKPTNTKRAKCKVSSS
jgi:cell division protein FtsW (lipid II flippase)